MAAGVASATVTDCTSLISNSSGGSECRNDSDANGLLFRDGPAHRQQRGAPNHRRHVPLLHPMSRPTQISPSPAILAILVIGSLASVTLGDDTAAFTEPYRDVELSVSEMGTLSHVDVKEGDQVSLGQVLAGLDETVVAATLVTAEKAMEGRGRLKSAQAELSRSEDNLKKLTELYRRRHATDQEIAPCSIGPRHCGRSARSGSR